MSKTIGCFSLWMASLIMLASPVAYAAESPWVSAEHVRGRLIIAQDTIGPSGKIEGGIELEMTEGWHTYWKMSGDSGLPPRFDHSASKNITEFEILYPAPERKDEAGLQVFGYKTRVFFPFSALRTQAAFPAILALKINVMVCKEICMPQNLDLSIDLESGAQEKINESHQRRIELEKRKIPASEDSQNLKTTTIVLAEKALAVGIYSKEGFDHADMTAFTDEMYLTAPPTIQLQGEEKNSAILTLAKPEDVEDLKAALTGKTLKIFISDGRNALEKQVSF